MTEKLYSIWNLIRPSQWIKNGFVFAGILFINAWTDYPLLFQVTLAAIGFSFLSSSIYVFNDILDRENDRHHPKKMHRPIAAGKISVPLALVVCFVCLFIAFWIVQSLPHRIFYIYIAYLVLNLLYSKWLKHIVILDVFCIAGGFMLRILAGTVGVGIPPSKWLLLCSLMITLFLGFAKRRAEIMALKGPNKEEHRQVLENYGSILLDEIIAICGTGVILSYSLYTMSPETVATHHTESLIYTVPFVIYALFRYIYLLHHRQGGGDPSRELVKDLHIIVSVLGWLAATLYILNRHHR